MPAADDKQESFKKLNHANKRAGQLPDSAYSVSKDVRSELLTIKEYRETLGDYESSDEQIEKRLQYLEAFCRNIARLELESLKNNAVKN